MKPYDHTKIEKKWQKYWESKKVNRAKENQKGKTLKKKFYALIEFPYPSGDGLHVGHIRSNTAMDIISRKRRREGYEVLYPIGWDAFGLPTENYAIKTGIQPEKVTKKNTDTFRKQLKALGFSFDWDREINTTDPKYYKWTQWIFLQFLKKGLAYKKKMTINWCPKDLIGLANEEVIDGKCERCGTPVEKREKEQWMLAITKYADRLHKDLDQTDFLEKIKIQQRNWIGKSEGAEIEFNLVLKENKPNFLILHGFEGSPKDNFIPWLKKSLENSGYRVEAPELPNSSNPKESEQVDYVLKNCHIDESTVIIGHSLGAIVAMKVVEKLKTKISGLVLVSAAMDPKFTKNVKPYHKNFDWHFNFDDIKNKITSGTAILSDTEEPHRLEYLKYLSGNLNAILLETKAKEKHYCAKEEPDILKAVTVEIKVYTTRPDTLYGVTYIVLSSEHAWVGPLLDIVTNKEEVERYLNGVKNKTEIERTAEDKEKTGVELKGVKAINPANREEIPVWIADYVLSDYGTGAVMAVPAHDERDFEFAKKYKLQIKEVVIPKVIDEQDPPRDGVKVVERNAVQAIVINPSDNKVLMLKWKKYPWTTFITGGIEGNEDIVEAAKREIQEETGYINIKYIKTLGGPVESHFYANHKNENRKATFHGLVFELVNNEVKEIDEKEKDIHDVAWMSWDELSKDKNIKCSEYDIWLDRFFKKPHAYTDPGVLVNSEKFNGKNSTDIKKEITESVGGQWVTKYKLRDWVFSRQRYWGEPIPVIHCEKCGVVPVPEKDLPVKLPRVKNYKPTETGESPLALISKWVNTKCPRCKGKAKRETDTMPNWAGSSWYYLRYADPKNNKEFASKKALKYWTPVDWYNGGMEHTTLHLLYSRFWHKFLYDLELVPSSEPYKKRTSHGLILAEGGEKMSKSKGNVINPDDIIKTVGADTLRIHEMFMGPFDQAIAWDTNAIAGARRFIERVWKLQEKIALPKEIRENEKIDAQVHKTIKKVSEDIEDMKFNTAISAMMILVNEFEKEEKISKENYEFLLGLLAPFAPHVAEEIWTNLKNKVRLHEMPWPKFNPKKIVESDIRITIQVNGKVRGSMEVESDLSDQEIQNMALSKDEIRKWIEGKEVKRVIIIKNKLINIVIN
jgi:leucyl-tRNA synthetase